MSTQPGISGSAGPFRTPRTEPRRESPLPAGGGDSSSAVTVAPDMLHEFARRALSGRVAAVLAHEINNLLTGILCSVTDIAGPGQSPEVRKALATSAECARQIADRIRAFQTVFHSDTLAHSARPVNLSEVLTRTVLLSRTRATWRGTAVCLEPGPCGEVRGDIGVLEQVFLELVYDVLETARGGLLKIATRQTGPCLAVTIGIEEETSAVPQVAEPDDPPYACAAEPVFADDAATGIGIAAAAAAVRSCGGNLMVAQTPNAQLKAIVTLPLWETGLTTPE